MRRYTYCVGDVVSFEDLTYDVVKATYKYIIIKNNIREIEIHKKSDFKKIKLLQEVA